MDIENSPNFIEAHASVNDNLKPKTRKQNFLIQNKFQNDIEINRRNQILSPEKRQNFTNFRRMDIDEEKEKR